MKLQKEARALVVDVTIIWACCLPSVSCLHRDLQYLFLVWFCLFWWLFFGLVWFFLVDCYFCLFDVFNFFCGFFVLFFNVTLLFLIWF